MASASPANSSCGARLASEKKTSWCARSPASSHASENSSRPASSYSQWYRSAPSLSSHGRGGAHAPSSGSASTSRAASYAYTRSLCRASKSYPLVAASAFSASSRDPNSISAKPSVVPADADSGIVTATADAAAPAPAGAPALTTDEKIFVT